MNEETCPPTGQNTKGMVVTKNAPPFLATVEFIAPGRMLFVRDAQGKQYSTPMNQFTPLPRVPARYREYVFQSVAHFWAEALNKFPDAITINPGNLTNETLARKLRETRIAKDKYGWQSPAISDTKWASIASQLLITPLDNGLVQIGPQTAKNIAQFDATLVTNTQTFTVKWTDKATLELFCGLVSQRAFEPRPHFTIYGLNEALITDLEARYDVGFAPNADGKSWEVIF